MKKLLFLITFLIIKQMIFAQETNGVIPLNLPLRNTIVLNKMLLNPTFSFVREQYKYITFSNSRQWMQFENAPVTFTGSYSGRMSENIGAGLMAFQQNYGVITTFGGILNFAYNIKINNEQNFTFGLNSAIYNSSLNTGAIISNVDDPSLQNIPSNLIISLNPGINYGTEFFDFGVSVNNIALYNFENSEIIKDERTPGIQAHIMTTGYLDRFGSLSDSKITGYISAEFNNESTIINAIGNIITPLGLWLQLGYNSQFGPSGGLGVNISKNIAIEYNIEKALGDVSNLGLGHQFTLAYRIINKRGFDYSGDEKISGILKKGKLKQKVKDSEEELEGIRARAKERKEQAELKREQERAEAEAKKEAEKQEKLRKIEEEKINNLRQKELLAQREKEKKEQERLALEKAKADAKLRAEQQEKERIAALEIQKQKEAQEKEAKLKEQQDRIKAELEAKKREAEIEFQKEIDKKQNVEDLKARENKANNVKEENIVINKNDRLGNDIKELSKETENSIQKQNNLIKEFESLVDIKDKDLKDLKEENDLSEKGIAVKPKAFKSVTEENNKIKGLGKELDKLLNKQEKQIEDLKALYDRRVKIKGSELDEVSLFYRKKIKRLENERLKALSVKNSLSTQLEEIKEATEYEKRRRIVKADYDNEQDRYNQDRDALNRIKNNTTQNNELNEEDFDFGEELGNNIKILKNINNIENGYYIIIAIHNQKSKRDDFITKVVSTGDKEVDFFFDVNTSKYYIYTKKFNTISGATEHLNNKGSKPYNKKMSIIKIEN